MKKAKATRPSPPYAKTLTAASLAEKGASQRASRNRSGYADSLD